MNLHYTGEKLTDLWKPSKSLYEKKKIMLYSYGKVYFGQIQWLFLFMLYFTVRHSIEIYFAFYMVKFYCLFKPIIPWYRFGI